MCCKSTSGMASRAAKYVLQRSWKRADVRLLLKIMESNDGYNIWTKLSLLQTYTFANALKIKLNTCKFQQNIIIVMCYICLYITANILNIKLYCFCNSYSAEISVSSDLYTKCIMAGTYITRWKFALHQFETRRRWKFSNQSHIIQAYSSSICNLSTWYFSDAYFFPYCGMFKFS